MRPWISMLMTAFASLAAAGPLDQAKADLVVPAPSRETAAPVGLPQLFQLLAALGIVLALLKWVLPKVMAKMNKRLVTKVGSTIRIEETAAFAGGMLYVVTARDKTLLLAVGAQGVQCLADLTQAAPQSNREHDEEPAFFELVEHAGHKTSEALAAVHIPEQPSSKGAARSPQQAQFALDRLSRLVR